MHRSVIMLTLCPFLTGALHCAEVSRPVLRFTRGQRYFPSGVAEIEAADDVTLGKMYRDEMAGGAVVPYRHYGRVYGAMGLWESTGEERYRRAALRVCHAMLGDIAEADDTALQALMDADEGYTVRSRTARDAAYHLALVYRLTGDVAYAHRSAVLLTRFAQVMPDWPIQNPHFGPMEDRKMLPRTWPGYVGTDRINGVWGGWIYMAIRAAVPLAYAYDLIHDSGELQRMGALAAVEGELNWAVEFQLGYGREMGNMDKETMKGLIEFGQLLGRPELVHHCIRWIRDMYQSMFFADGWWHEGSVSYHQQIHGGMRTVIADYLQGYTDPPGYTRADGTRHDDLDLFAMLKGPMGRADAVLRDIHQPNGDYQCVHDTSFPQVAWEKLDITRARSHLWGSMGHCILGSGTGQYMVQATLHFSGIHGHAHYDALNLMLFAKGKELISETCYRPIEGSESTREWHTNTAGHVTVVVDGANQSVTTRRSQQPTDAMPGIPDGKYRWRGHGNHLVDGRLRLHNATFADVQVVEADAARVYAQTKDGGVYRRLIALVRFNETETYVVDIFRVRGGNVHDYMIHGCLSEPHDLDLSLPLDSTMPETLHKYIGDLRCTTTDKPWSATHSVADGAAKMRTWMMPQQQTRVILGQGPAMRRKGKAPFLCVRHSGGESIFVAVHHPFSKAPLVKGVQLLDASMESVSLKVTLPGRVDTIVSTGDGFSHRAGGQWLYEVGGRHARTGRVRGTYRREAGDPLDAVRTDVELPDDDSLDGATMVVDIGGLLVQSVLIERVERRGGETVILTQGDPGFVVKPDLVRLVYFPGWGIEGEARFRIAASRKSSDQ